MTIQVLPFEEYMTIQLDKFGGRSAKVPEQLLRGWGACRTCGDWQLGANSFVEIVDGQASIGNLCGRCAGVWSYNPGDESKGCLMTVYERALYDPVWGTTPDALAHPWIVDCAQQNCFYHVAAQSEDRALSLDIMHPCPYKGGKTTEGLMVPLRLMRDAWEELDDTMDWLKEHDNSAGGEEALQYARFRGDARGQAKIISKFMPPPYKDNPDEVAREAQRRWEARNRGETYQTPELVSPTLDTPPNEYMMDAVTPSTLTEQERAAIKKALDADFPIEKLAEIYKTSAAVIKSCR